MHRDQGWLAEGWIEPGPADLCPRSLQKTKGDFALFALHEDGVLLASGRAGGYRPVYVAWPSRESVVASTRLAALLALLPQPPPLDLEYLSASLLNYGPRPPESTPYSGVRRVPPGEAWVVRPGTPQQRWSTLTPLLEPELRDDGQLAIRLRQAITEATRRAAGNATRLAVEVSGGLDSSFLLTLLLSFARAGQISAPPEAIAYESVAPPWHDDRPYLRSLERHVGVRAHRVSPRDAAALVGQLMVIDAMPAPTPTLSAAKCVGTIARAHGVDVVIAGQGGDHLDGSPRLFGELARKGRMLRALDGTLRTRGVFYQGPLGRLARFLLWPLLEPLLPRSGLRSLQRLRRRPPPWAGPAFIRHLGARAVLPPPYTTLEEAPGERYARRLQLLSLSPWSLIRAQEEVVGGYALRTPFFDDDFLRFAATLPPLSLFQGGFLRGLMREAMRGLVPEDLRLRKTKGSAYWFVEQALEEAGGLDVLADLADVRMLADLRLVEPGPFHEFFDGFAGTSSDDANYFELWSILSVEAFLRQYNGEAAARAA